MPTLREDEDPIKPDLSVFVTITLVFIFCVALRVVCLCSDPYPSLSWSSALLTDEGFYLHHARNAILFSQNLQDQFDNSLIMPLLDLAQRGVFSWFGVGFVQTRLISVFCSLFSILFLYGSLKNFAGRECAVAAAALYGLDHVTLLYSRMGLMDTPALLPILAGFYSFSCACHSFRNERHGEGNLALFLCGLCLIAGYATRGLSVLVFPAPLIALTFFPFAEKKQRKKSFVLLLGGLLLGFALYFMFWMVPHRIELANVNRFYLTHQLLPGSPSQLLKNIGNAFFGVERGMFPFLLRHTPVLTIGTLLSLFTFFRERSEKPISPERIFLVSWVLVGWFLCSVISYSPSRYYVLFLPGMAALCTLTFGEKVESKEVTPFSPFGIKVLKAFCVYHLSLICLSAVPFSFGVAGVLAILISLLPLNRLSAFLSSFVASNAKRRKMFYTLWAIVNTGWLLHWSFTLSYTQRDSAQWLTTHLPANSVLYGDVASGLAPNLPFRVVPVIPGLSNEALPIISPGSPRFLLILDNPYLPKFWKERYSALIQPLQKVQTFPKIVKFPAILFRFPDTPETRIPYSIM